MSAPLISVVINTYNHERFIADAIRSVLAQDFPLSNFETIVVDDGSTDRTPEIARQFEPEVRLFRKANGDQCSAVSFGVAQATGELIALLDGDDIWLPNKLSCVAREFAKHPRTVMVYHKYVFWDMRDNSEWVPNYFTEVSGDVLADRSKLLIYGAAPTSSLVFRREAFQRFENIPMDRDFMYDTFLFSAVIFLGPVSCISEILTKNRIHGSNRWAAAQAGPSPATIQRRIARRKATIEILHDWIWANAPKSSRRQARILLWRWRLIQHSHEFLLEPPNRFRYFVHLCRYALLERPILSFGELAYRWAKAFAILAVGSHAHYLEGVRTRAKKLRQHFQSQRTPADSGESAERVS